MADNAETNFYIVPALFFDQYYGYAGSSDTLTNIAAGSTAPSYRASQRLGSSPAARCRGWRSRGRFLHPRLEGPPASP
jgi:hypothetical protein